MLEEAWQTYSATKLKVPEETNLQNLQEVTTNAQELERHRPSSRPVKPCDSVLPMVSQFWILDLGQISALNPQRCHS